MVDRYLVAATKSWNRRTFEEVLSKLPGEWHFISSPEELLVEAIERIDPAFIFFLHWSWKVPSEIIDKYNCVAFHMTDVPYGRGGSPLQNLIVRGHKHTKLTALRMTESFDAGPVYLKEDLCLEGSAEEVYIRASHLSAQMARRIIEDGLAPRSQEGEPTTFRRRTPSESQIPELNSIQDLHDFIRMLDAEGYPRAFLEHNGFRYEFSRTALYDGRIAADVTIIPANH